MTRMSAFGGSGQQDDYLQSLNMPKIDPVRSTTPNVRNPDPQGNFIAKAQAQAQAQPAPHYKDYVRNQSNIMQPVHKEKQHVR
jgi:hypothetical protein